MLLSFEPPKKIMSEEERVEKYSSDSNVPGTFVPNMSVDDMRRWKGKHIKGKDERVEIRKSIWGTQIVIIVYKNELYEDGELERKQVQISANGKMYLTLEEYKELQQVIDEALYILNK